MALQLKEFVWEDRVFEHAYLRISKIRTNRVDYEYLEKVEDDSDIDQKLSWMIRQESTATAFIWEDKAARDNRAIALDWFSFDFDFDLESDRNIYQQAYDALKEAEEYKDALDV